MTYTLYVLFDKREVSRVRYVGFTRDLLKRFYRHLGEAEHSSAKSHRLNWLRKVLNEGSAVGIRALAIVGTAEEAAELEIKAIASYRQTGHPLTNGTEGGEGVQGFGGILTADAVERKIASLNTPEYLELRRLQSSIYWASLETREQQRQVMNAHWSSERAEEHRRIIVETNKRIQTGRKRSPEAREKMRLAKLGKPGVPRTEEWKRKLSESNKGVKHRPMTEEQKNKHSEAMKNPETRRKMSESAKARKR